MVGNRDKELEERGDNLKGLKEEDEEGHKGVLEEDLAEELEETAEDGKRSCSCLSPGPARRFSVNRGFFKTMTRVHTTTHFEKVWPNWDGWAGSGLTNSGTGKWENQRGVS